MDTRLHKGGGSFPDSLFNSIWVSANLQILKAGLVQFLLKSVGNLNLLYAIDCEGHSRDAISAEGDGYQIQGSCHSLHNSIPS
jgi:hypothetical protein